jgi:cobalt-zinc-cadmium efflux system membrane fusion protein
MTQSNPTSQRSFFYPRSFFFPRQIALPLALSLAFAAGCKKADDPDKAAKEAPPSNTTVETVSSDSVTVERPERFPLVAATDRNVVSTLSVTGSVQPDVSKEVPVLSLANGRVVALHVGLGDHVRKGQLVMDVQSPDVATAFDTYLKTVHDEHLAALTLDRDKLLYDKGAIAQSQLQIAQDTEDDAKADLTASEQQLRILGVDKNNPSDTVHIYAPISGIVISQNVTASGAAGITYAGNNGSLVIADLSHVWVICDVYENDLAQVHLGEHADIHLNAFGSKVYSGTVSDIGAILDPSLRTAKVRIQIQNPDDQLRIGLFATASLSSGKSTPAVTVPANAILQLHDRDYVFEPSGTTGKFRRVEIKTGRTLDGNVVQVLNGIQAGQQVVSNALDLQNTADQQ